MAEHDAPASPLLRVSRISKSYAGVRALADASLEVLAGEVHALVGENGAGKSTLVKIVTGAVAPDEGTVEVSGRPVAPSSPRAAKALGIAAIYQQPALFPELTVAENIALGVERTGSWGRVDWRARRRRAAELLAHVGAEIDPESEAGDLTMPEQQLVEIARALGADARILILDEPTASLSAEDTRNLFDVVRSLRSRGVGMIYISHRLDELPEIADRMTVLRDGRTIDTRRMADVDRWELIRMMVGRELSAVFPKREVAIGDVVLELRGVGCSATGLRDVDLTVRAGEIVGLAGIVGAGRTELARAVFGVSPADAGSIHLNGALLAVREPADAIAAGIAYVPEDRRRHGVIPELSVAANISLASLGAISSVSCLDVGRENAIAADFVRRLGVKTPALYAPVATLSGGNQQKVALGRWLATKPTLLILDEPTQGVDVGAKAEIHALMSELAANGVAILMISSELPEILGMSDRVVVMREGTVAGELARADASQEGVLALALGHSTDEAQEP